MLFIGYIAIKANAWAGGSTNEWIAMNKGWVS